MILDNDVRKDEFYKGLSAVDMNCTETPRIVTDYMEYVARTGLPLFEWSFLCPFIQLKLEQEAKNLHRDSHETMNEMEFDVIVQMCKDRLAHFRGIPFTMQRICELLADVRGYYQRADKFLRGFTKLIMIVSTIDSEGNKLVENDDRVSLRSEQSTSSPTNSSLRTSQNGSLLSSSGNLSTTPPMQENGFSSRGGTCKMWSPTTTLQPQQNATFSPPSSPPGNSTSPTANNNNSHTIGVRSPYPHNSRVSPSNGSGNGTVYSGLAASGSKRISAGFHLRSPMTSYLEVEEDGVSHTDAGESHIETPSSSTDFTAHSDASEEAMATPSSSGPQSNDFESKDMRPIGRLEEIVEKMPSLVGNVIQLSLPEAEERLHHHAFHLAPLKQTPDQEEDEEDEEEMKVECHLSSQTVISKTHEKTNLDEELIGTSSSIPLLTSTPPSLKRPSQTEMNMSDMEVEDGSSLSLDATGSPSVQNSKRSRLDSSEDGMVIEGSSFMSEVGEDEVSGSKEEKEVS